MKPVSVNKRIGYTLLTVLSAGAAVFISAAVPPLLLFLPGLAGLMLMWQGRYWGAANALLISAVAGLSAWQLVSELTVAGHAGVYAGAFIALVTLSGGLTAAYLHSKRTGSGYAVAYMWFAVLLGAGAVLAVMQLRTGDIISGFFKWFENGLDRAVSLPIARGMEAYRLMAAEAHLTAEKQAAILSTVQGMAPGQLFEGFRDQLDTVLRSVLPAVILAGSFLWGIITYSICGRAANRWQRAKEQPAYNEPRLWGMLLPRAVYLIIGLLLLVSFIAAEANPAFASLRTTAMLLVLFIIILNGAALADFLLLRLRVPWLLRALIIPAAAVFFTVVLIVMGFIDSLFSPRIRLMIKDKEKEMKKEDKNENGGDGNEGNPEG